MKQRPVGVLIYGVLFIVSALTPLCAVLAIGLRAARGWLRTPAEVSLGIGIMVGSGLIGLLLLTIGVGLLMVTRWARWLALLSAILTVLWVGFVDVTRFTAGVKEPVRHFLIINSALMLGWCGLMIWYFLRPSVKAQFQRRP